MQPFSFFINRCNSRIFQTAKYIMLQFFVSFTLFFIFINHSLADDSYAVFTLNNNFKELSKSKVRMLYRGKIKLLQGKKIELSDWSENNVMRNEFYQNLLSKDVAQMNAYWASLSFSGKARPPKVIKEDSIKFLLDWLSEKQTRIGYAKLELLPPTVNVLYIVKKEKQ